MKLGNLNVKLEVEVLGKRFYKIRLFLANLICSIVGKLLKARYCAKVETTSFEEIKGEIKT
jgi:hypothetical protein